MSEAEMRMRGLLLEQMPHNTFQRRAISEGRDHSVTAEQAIRAMLAAEAAAIERERGRVEKAIRDHCDQHGPSGGAWNVSMILEATQRTLKEGASHVG